MCSGLISLKHSYFFISSNVQMEPIIILIIEQLFKVMKNIFLSLFSDLTLEPNIPIRALTNTILTLFCLNNSTVMSDGNFQWFHDSTQCNDDNKLCNHGNNHCHYDNILCNINYTLCNSTSCRNSKNTPISSKLTLMVDDTTEGNWRCSFIKQKNC